MAKAKQKVESKQLKLVCKCGSCTHWEVILHMSADGQEEGESLVCVACGVEFDCSFGIGPHEGLHYERHTKGDEKKACAPRR